MIQTLVSSIKLRNYWLLTTLLVSERKPKKNGEEQHPTYFKRRFQERLGRYKAKCIGQRFSSTGKVERNVWIRLKNVSICFVPLDLSEEVLSVFPVHLPCLSVLYVFHMYLYVYKNVYYVICSIKVLFC